MTLLGPIVVLIAVGLLLYLLGTLPLDPTIKTIIRVIVILAVILWLCDFHTRIGR